MHIAKSGKINRICFHLMYPWYIRTMLYWRESHLLTKYLHDIDIWSCLTPFDESMLYPLSPELMRDAPDDLLLRTRILRPSYSLAKEYGCHICISIFWAKITIYIKCIGPTRILFAYCNYYLWIYRALRNIVIFSDQSIRDRYTDYLENIVMPNEIHYHSRLTILQKTKSI